VNNAAIFPASGPATDRAGALLVVAHD